MGLYHRHAALDGKLVTGAPLSGQLEYVLYAAQNKNGKVAGGFGVGQSQTVGGGET